MQKSPLMLAHYYALRESTPNKADKYLRIIAAIQDGHFEEGFSIKKKLQLLFYMAVQRVFAVFHTGFYYYFAPYFITFFLIFANTKFGE